MKAVIWSKKGCGFCIRAKRLLEAENIEYEERNIDSSKWSKEDLLKAVPNVKTLPQIFLDDKYIGGYNELAIELLG